MSGMGLETWNPASSDFLGMLSDRSDPLDEATSPLRNCDFTVTEGQRSI